MEPNTEKALPQVSTLPRRTGFAGFRMSGAVAGFVLLGTLFGVALVAVVERKSAETRQTFAEQRAEQKSAAFAALLAVTRAREQTPNGPAAADLRAAERSLRGWLAADPETPNDTQNRALLFLLLGALVGGVVAGVWAQARFVAPISTTFGRVRDFVHGTDDARADAAAGGRDAREVALAVNALIDRAHRAIDQGRAARKEDVDVAVMAIESLGEGDLRGASLPVGPPFEPIERAVERARRGMLDRVTELHASAMKVAGDAATLGLEAKAAGSAEAEQLAAVKRIADAAEEAQREVHRATQDLRDGVDALRMYGAEHRHAAQEIRASFSGVSRRVMALKNQAGLVKALVANAKSLDQALSMLHRLGGQSDVAKTRERATALVGSGRATLDDVADKLAALSEELARTSHQLELVSQSQPEPVAELDTHATEPLFQVTAALLRSAESTGTGLRQIEQSARTVTRASANMRESAEAVSAQVPRLSSALAAIRVGSSFEEELLARLKRMRDEIAEGKNGPARMSKDGQALVREVEAAAREAKEKLGRMVVTTEAAINGLRAT